jgi:hypothetical protein
VSWWEGKHYPDAGEVIGWRCSEPGPKAWPGPADRLAGLVDEVPEAAAGSAAPPRPDESNRERASRRARTRLRRYAVANRLRYLWVLTIDPAASGALERDLTRSKRAVAEWVKRGLRGEVGYEGAYVIGFERHKSGAWHINVLLGEYLPQDRMTASWGRGHTWVSKFRGRQGESMRDAARRAAGYVAKYVSKEFADLPGGVHRYEVAQGFAVREVRVFALSATGLVEECGREILYRFDAPAAESGRGPPIVWAALG